MRMKRRHDKGEIFRKSLSCVQCQSDSEDCDGVGSDAENHKVTTKPKKTEEKTVKESTERRNKKESHRKQMTSAHDTKKHSASRASTSSSKCKHSRSKKDEHSRVDSSDRKQQQNDSNIAIISKNRITRSLGIYNKAKRSDTILRENLKEKLCRKKFEDIKSKTAEDMARVLDCSSFKIQLSSCSGGLHGSQDSPAQHTSGDANFLIQSPAGSNKTHTSSCSSTGKYSNPDKNKVTPLQRITPQRITPQNEAKLAFKTPLQEISDTLTQTLRPSETFHGRNYFAEVQGQLRKIYKQSKVQRIADNVGVASEVQKRCLKRKSVEENSSVSESTRSQQTAQSLTNDHFVQSDRHMSVPVLQTESKENIRHQNRVLQEVSVKELGPHSSRETSRSSKYQDKLHNGVTNRERKLEDEKKHNFPNGRDVQRCLFAQQDPHFSQTDVQAFVAAHSSSSFDILDFLDGIDQASNLEEMQVHKGYLTPDPRLVSPPKKPTLESPTPENIFYPHKLY